MRMESDKLYELYKKMRRIACVEDVIADKYYEKDRKMHTPIHLYNGQEAVAVGVCENLDREDVVFSNHRCHGHYLAKGGNLKKMVAELYSKNTGCCKGKGGSMHLCDMEAGVAPASAIVAGNVSIATGYAMGNKLKGNYNVSCVFFGDGASEEGSVYESICFARLKKLPILFVCENNRYAINTPLEEREPLNTISEKFSNILPVSVLDGNDIEVVTGSAKEAVTEIRNGKGPIFLEYITYRTRAHHNIGDGVNEKIRTQEEWNMWKEKDPVELARKSLIKHSRKYVRLIDLYEEELMKEIEEAFAFAEESPFPKKEEMWEDIWG